MRFIAFDVETPNCMNNSICSIGISLIEGGKAVENRHYLVDPCADFDDVNIRIHGITPEMVAGAPTFPELWRLLGPVFQTGILVAHNAAFDLGVLRKLMNRHAICQPNATYVCTYQMSRRLLPKLPNHKLNTISDYMGISLNHHDAGSDSFACGEILNRLLADGHELNPHLREYDFSPCGGTVKKNCRKRS